MPTHVGGRWGDSESGWGHYMNRGQFFGGRLYILLLKGVISLAGFYVQFGRWRDNMRLQIFRGEIILVH